MVGSQNRLDLQQQMVAPGAKVIAILGVQLFRALAVPKIATQVAIAIGSPTGVRRREIGDAQSGADTVKNVVELALLFGSQRPGEHLMRSLRVIDEHVQ